MIENTSKRVKTSAKNAKVYSVVFPWSFHKVIDPASLTKCPTEVKAVEECASPVEQKISRMVLLAVLKDSQYFFEMVVNRSCDTAFISEIQEAITSTTAEVLTSGRVYTIDELWPLTNQIPNPIVKATQEEYRQIAILGVDGAMYTSHHKLQDDAYVIRESQMHYRLQLGLHLGAIIIAVIARVQAHSVQSTGISFINDEEYIRFYIRALFTPTNRPKSETNNLMSDSGALFDDIASSISNPSETGVVPTNSYRFMKESVAIQQEQPARIPEQQPIVEHPPALPATNLFLHTQQQSQFPPPSPPPRIPFTPASQIQASSQHHLKPPSPTPLPPQKNYEDQSRTPVLNSPAACTGFTQRTSGEQSKCSLCDAYANVIANMMGELAQVKGELRDAHNELERARTEQGRSEHLLAETTRLLDIERRRHQQ